MVAELHEFSVRTRVGEIVNITENVEGCVQKSSIKDGLVNIFLPGSTGGITTIEYEPGLVRTDIPEFLQKIIPEGPDYAHHQTWGDHNGAGHIRSFLIKPSLTVPLHNGKLLLGTWQQIIFCEFDERARSRTIYCQFVG
jgi:secondary thiamine-phosphate synthase enzyme